MTVEDLKIYLDNYPDDSPVYAYCDDETIHTIADIDPVCIKSNSFGIMLSWQRDKIIMKIGDIVYLAEPVEWCKTPDGDWNEHIYPVNTPVKIIGDSGYRGWDIEFVETGVKNV